MSFWYGAWFLREAELKFWLALVAAIVGLICEREELVCAGDSLDVLDTSECGIEDPEALLEQLYASSRPMPSATRGRTSSSARILGKLESEPPANCGGRLNAT